MLAIRLRRQGRSGHAHYRVIVQDSRWHPTNGKVVAYLGTYDPHTKATQVDADAAKTFLNNGAQPSPRVARILKTSGVKLPGWVSITKENKSATRNPDKLRKNRPKGAPTPAPKAAEPAEAKAEEVVAEAPVEAVAPETKEPEVAAEATTKEEPATKTAPEAPESPSEEPAAEAEAPTK